MLVDVRARFRRANSGRATRVGKTGYRTAEIAVAEQFVVENDRTLTAVLDQYRDVMQVIRNDQEFLAYLREEVALAALRCIAW